MKDMSMVGTPFKLFLANTAYPLLMTGAAEKTKDVSAIWQRLIPATN